MHFIDTGRGRDNPGGLIETTKSNSLSGWPDIQWLNDAGWIQEITDSTFTANLDTSPDFGYSTIVAPNSLPDTLNDSDHRDSLEYLDQLAKFHKQHDDSVTRFPRTNKRPLDLYQLKKIVEQKGGFEKACKSKEWPQVGRELGYSGSIMSSVATSLKNVYQKWLLPYEECLRLAGGGNQGQHAQQSGKVDENGVGGEPNEVEQRECIQTLQAEVNDDDEQVITSKPAADPRIQEEDGAAKRMAPTDNDKMREAAEVLSGLGNSGALEIRRRDEILC